MQTQHFYVFSDLAPTGHVQYPTGYLRETQYTVYIQTSQPPGSVYSESNLFTVRLASPTVRYPRNQAIMQDLGVQNDSHRLVTHLGMDF